MRRHATLAAILVLGLLAPAGRPEQPPGLGGAGAAEAIEATLDVERTMLREDLERYDRVAADRAEVTARLQELYGQLRASVRKEDASAEAVETILARVEQAESERADRVGAEVLIVERLRDRLRRIGLLGEHLGALRERAEVVAGPLGGAWEVVLMPQNQRGTLDLVQSGTLVSGTYALEGGWTGSMQGTLVNRKVFLLRIDSKLGRSAEFEGYLSHDGKQIRGTWLSYELSGEGGSNGQWTAHRRSASP